MQKKSKYIQLFGDAIIPLMGLLFWNWGLYFILLFYGFDLILKEILLHFKSAKINRYRQNTQINYWLINGLKSFGLLIVSILLIHFLMPFLDVNFSFQAEIIAFWTYEDMGIQQGYVLIPLLALGGYMQYKAEFLMTKHYEQIEVPQVWKSHIRAELIILASIGLIIGISQFYLVPNTILVLFIILGSAAYQWFKLVYSEY